MFVLGFGFHPATKKYKVVKLVYYKDDFYSYQVPPEVEIYTLSIGARRRVRSAPPKYGCVRNLIVSFDMSDEVFGTLMLPDAIDRLHGLNMSLAVLGESLALFNYDNPECCCIWVMKEYGVPKSWTRLVTIGLAGALVSTVRKNGEVLISTSDDLLASYDPTTQQINDIGIRGNSLIRKNVAESAAEYEKQSTMERNNDIAEASICSSSSKKQKVSGIEQEDRIGRLPDSILSHILSFLPTKDAVKTVLFCRFGHLWTSIHNLDFNVCLYDHLAFTHPNDKWFLNFMDHVLLLHDYPTILKFGLKFRSAVHQKPSLIRHENTLSPEIADKIDLWIHFAVRKKVKVLELDMLEQGLYGPLFDYDLPDFVLMSDSLKELKLVSRGLKPKGQIRLGALKTLSFRTIGLNDIMIEQILFGCPLLENLTLIRCYVLHKLKLISTCLKILTVTCGEAETSRLKISCPNLKTLNISGSIGYVDLKNTSSLVDATLEFNYGGRYSNDEYHSVGMLLEELNHAKFLTLCNWCIMEDKMWQYALGIYQNNCWNDELWLTAYDFNEETFWNSQQQFPCLTNHLKTIRIYGCIENSFLIQLLKFLLASSSVLEKMVIFTKENAVLHQQKLEKLLEFSQKLFRFPKASNNVNSIRLNRFREYDGAK
ncbi:hypothetical protein F0562_008368 [Nyssa sinensis]|uniref:F-box domain-containing protein n=1 Tax=Nyssa sinensis TaxID=561372 RepID=A0A5J5A815_9ASTE|nr:hypothetical protein F0562_008368 [Nyssa sinensis]